MRRRRFIALGVFAVVLAACTQKPIATDATYYLVRHAEKTAEKPDPALTEAGEQRARDLADVLGATELSAIYSSDYTRTRDTAAPTALAKGLDIQIYNPGALADFADQLKTQSGAILVVGHSNTTPQLSELLGGPSGDPIEEATEYNRLYILERRGDVVTGRIDRFGE